MQTNEAQTITSDYVTMLVITLLDIILYYYDTNRQPSVSFGGLTHLHTITPTCQTVFK